MSRYLVTWEAAMNRFPIDAEKRSELLRPMIEMVQEDIKEGRTISWGAFVGGGKGYAVSEGNASDLYKNLQRWSPYFTFDVQEVLSIEEVTEAFK